MKDEMRRRRRVLRRAGYVSEEGVLTLKGREGERVGGKEGF
jgi:hypothetical protein